MPTEAQIAGGHKATLNNPNVSQGAKQHSKEVLENEFNGGNGRCHDFNTLIFLTSDFLCSTQGWRQWRQEPWKRCWWPEGVSIYTSIARSCEWKSLTKGTELWRTQTYLRELSRVPRTVLIICRFKHSFNLRQLHWGNLVDLTSKELRITEWASIMTNWNIVDTAT